MNEVVFKKRFNVKKDLFSDNEQGLWLDPSDMTREKAGWRRNLLTNSQRFTLWSGGSSNVTANNETAPDGTLTASTINRPGGGSYAILPLPFVTFLPNTVYTMTLYIKAGTQTTAAFGVYSNSAGAFVSGTASVISGTASLSGSALIQVTGLTSSWTRLQLTFTSASTGTSDVYFYPVTSSGAGNFASGTNIIWGFQLELGSTPSEYQPITDFSTEFKSAFPTHTLYQDSNGVTPCTDSGQPVGLILDQSRGGLGAKTQYALTNGSFDSALTGWNAANATTDTSTSGQVSVTSTSGGAYGFIQATGANVITTAASNWYEIVVDCELISGTGFIGAYTTSGVYTFFTDTGRKTRKIIVQGSNVEARAGVTNSIGTSIIVYDIKVYQVPGNHAYQTTSGQRPTLARIPSSGRRNLLSYSEQLTNTAEAGSTRPWAVSAGANTVTPNYAQAPDGTNTANRLVFTSSSYPGRQQQIPVSLVAGQSYTFSVWIKRISGSNSGRLEISGGGGTVIAGFQTITGTADWQRVSLTLTAVGSGTASVYVYPEYSVSATGEYLLWGAQLETGSSVSNYQKVVATTDVTESGVSDLWHLVFDGSDDSLLTNAVDFATWTQETRRNLLTNVEDFDNAAWTKNISTITANSATAPDGTTTADTLTASAQYGNVTQPSTAAGTSFTFSCYAKKVGSFNELEIGLTNANNYINGFAAMFNLNTGVYVSQRTFGTGYTLTTYSITDAGSGWYRLVVSGTISVSAAPVAWCGLGVNSANGSTMLLWGAQLESGSTATTYQRVGTDEMTVIAGVRQAVTPSAENVIVELSTFYNNNSGTFIVNSNTSPNFGFAARGTSTGFYTPSATFPSTNVLSCNFDISGAALAQQIIPRINGQLSQSNPFGSLGSGNFGNYQLFIGRRNQSTLPFNGHLYQLIIRGKTTPTGKLLEAERFVGKKTGVSF